MPREILVDWTTASGGGKVSVTFWGESTPVADQRTALGTFLSAIKSQLDTSVSYTIRTAGRELDATTGTLTAAWSDSVSYTGTGVVNGEPVPDASMALMQWRTDHIVNGRFLQGRTFIPGVSTQTLTDGNFTAAAISAWNTAGANLIASGKQFGVWHRPTSGSGGVWWAADTASAWQELAVLRRRRG
jgi:hypothetical protein